MCSQKLKLGILLLSHSLQQIYFFKTEGQNLRVSNICRLLGDYLEMPLNGGFPQMINKYQREAAPDPSLLHFTATIFKVQPSWKEGRVNGSTCGGGSGKAAGQQLPSVVALDPPINRFLKLCGHTTNPVSPFSAPSLQSPIPLTVGVDAAQQVLP